MNNVQSDIVAWEIREGQKQSERSAAEQAYSVIAFDYAKAPVGSRDWCLFWNGWQACLHPRESGDQVAPRRDERPMAAESLAFEAWRTEQIECLKRNGYADAADAFYKLGSIHWLAWQARAALSQAKVTAAPLTPAPAELRESAALAQQCKDAERLDYLQYGVTVSLVPDNGEELLFQIGGRRESHHVSVRKAIDAAIALESKP